MEAPVNYGATNNNVDTKPSAAVPSGPSTYPHHPPTSSSAAVVVDASDIRPEVRNEKNPVGKEGVSDKTSRSTREMNRLDTLCVVGFCLGLVGFLCTFHLKLLPRIPYPLVKNLQDADPTMMAVNLWQDGVNVIPVIWGFRYIRKIGLTLFNFSCLASPIDDADATGSGPPPDAEVAVRPAEPEVGGCCAARNPCWPGYIVPVVAYHLILGIWMGLATNYHIPYQVSDLEWLIVGLVLFVTGELIIVVRMWLARRTLVKAQREEELAANTSSDHLRPPAPPGRPPVKVVEVGEVLSCLGFAVYTLTLPACIMALVRFVIAIPAFLGKIHGKAF